MKWYGIIAFLFLIGILGGVVVVGFDGYASNIQQDKQVTKIETMQNDKQTLTYEEPEENQCGEGISLENGECVIANDKPQPVKAIELISDEELIDSKIKKLNSIADPVYHDVMFRFNEIVEKCENNGGLAEDEFLELVIWRKKLALDTVFNIGEIKSNPDVIKLESDSKSLSTEQQALFDSELSKFYEEYAAKIELDAIKLKSSADSCVFIQEPKSELEPRSEPKPEPRSDPKPKSEPKSEPKPDPKPKSDPEPEPDPKPKSEPKPKPKVKYDEDVCLEILSRMLANLSASDEELSKYERELKNNNCGNN